MCFFIRKVAWQPLIELHSCAWHILMPTSRAKSWGIICLFSLTDFLSNPLQNEIAEGVYAELWDRVYIKIFLYWLEMYSSKDATNEIFLLEIQSFPNCQKHEKLYLIFGQMSSIHFTVVSEAVKVMPLAPSNSSLPRSKQGHT